MEVLTFIHLSSCLLMTGVIWMVQIVHYPTFKFIDYKSFTLFSAFHAKSISSIVIPLMLIEIATAAILIIQFPGIALFINFILLLITWGVTFLVSMPLHKELQRQQSTRSIEKLINSNWVRTSLWTLRSVFLWTLIARSLGGTL
ncbi:MAG: hypothetical protein ACI9QD_000368 [Thermoproteota archaeon]|jgi:hypothetical protein